MSKRSCRITWGLGILAVVIAVVLAVGSWIESRQPPRWNEGLWANSGFYYQERPVAAYEADLGAPLFRTVDPGKPGVEYWYYRTRGQGFSMVQMQFQVRDAGVRFLYGCNLLTPDTERQWLGERPPG